MPFTQIASSRDERLEAQIRAVGHEHGLHNLFNPSLLTHGGTTYIAIRGNTPPHYRPFRSYLIELSRTSRPKLTDLTAAASAIGIQPVADPKLLVLDGDIYASFNTGHRQEGRNEIYLVKVSGGLGAFQRADFGGRRRIEKNWAFYRSPHGELNVLYNLAPFETLQLADGELGTTDDLAFATHQILDQPDYMQPLHIGTQISMIDDYRALLIANQRFAALKRAIYVGKLLELDLDAGAVVRTSRKKLINSWRTTLKRPKPLHNPSLVSATYFSGLAIEGERLVASFGINDVDFGIARPRIDELW